MKIEKLNLRDLSTSREKLTTTEHGPKPGYRIVTPTEQKSFLSLLSMVPAAFSSALFSYLPVVGKSLGAVTFLGISSVPWLTKLEPYEVKIRTGGPCF